MGGEGLHAPKEKNYYEEGEVGEGRCRERCVSSGEGKG